MWLPARLMLSVCCHCWCEQCLFPNMNSAENYNSWSLYSTFGNVQSSYLICEADFLMRSCESHFSCERYWRSSLLSPVVLSLTLLMLNGGGGGCEGSVRRKNICHEFLISSITLFVFCSIFPSHLLLRMRVIENSAFLRNAFYHAVSRWKRRDERKKEMEFGEERERKRRIEEGASFLLCLQLFRSSHLLFSCCLRHCSCSQNQGCGFDYSQSKQEGLSFHSISTTVVRDCGIEFTVFFIMFA